MRWLPLLFVLALTLPQCGGSNTATEPKTADSEASADSQDSRNGDAESDEAVAEEGSVEAKPRGPSCDDGTCTVCGNGICPTGWYCDESAPGGAACAWLKECAEKPSCGCVAKVLGSGCKCRDDGGIKVSCN